MEPKKILIKLNKKFYQKESIEQALKDYAEVAEGKLVDEKYTVSLIPNKEHAELPIKNEFCNYVLGLMKNNGAV